VLVSTSTDALDALETTPVVGLNESALRTRGALLGEPAPSVSPSPRQTAIPSTDLMAGSSASSSTPV